MNVGMKQSFLLAGGLSQLDGQSRSDRELMGKPYLA